jgi:CHAT domain-containing protein
MTHEHDNSEQASIEVLLRFLDAVPRNRANRGKEPPDELSGDPVSSETDSCQCPEISSFAGVALGTAELEKAQELLTHAATCRVCGDVLERTLRTLEGHPSPEEAAAIAELAAARADWQHKMARMLAGTSARRRPMSVSVHWLAGVAIAAGLAAVALFLWQQHTYTPEHQLAMAYSQSRVLELRVPGAAYAGLVAGSHTRGAQTDNEPAPLLEARARLARELERTPQDPHWLELQARADILAERYDSAADVLDRLLAQGPVTSALLVDAALAYYQRGLVSGSELDRSTSLDYLRRADQLTPTDPVVLFNEAIVMEERGQLMNAVEVWNRYINVERDRQWAAEGKRKLAAVQQILDRTRSHQSRINQMLATPDAINALINDKQKLASLDEELSSYEFDKLIHVAFPQPTSALSSSAGSAQDQAQGREQARGSPCDMSCLGGRRLLKAIASSLESQHHDYWFTDLFSPDVDSLPAATATGYIQALRLLGQASREDQTGAPVVGERKAWEARRLFLKMAKAGSSTPSVSLAAHTGEERASAEYLFALQRQLNFRTCRVFAQQLHTTPNDLANPRYPWIEAMEFTAERVCDDTPETRKTGRRLETAALRLAEANNYPLLIARIRLKLVGDATDAGDMEAAERLALATLRQLYSADAPPIRIVNTVSTIPYIERDSPRAQMTGLCLRESLGWLELVADHHTAGDLRMELARTEMRIGATKEAKHQLELAHREGDLDPGGRRGANFIESEIDMARAMLEAEDLRGAGHYLDLAAADLTNVSDTWTLRSYASSRGQFELAIGHLDEAAITLESDIRNSEGKNVRGGDPATIAEYAQQDHDLYAELAATWLAQGHSPERVLALWERFKLRSLSLPIMQCRGGALDCEQSLLAAVQRQLGQNVLIGQIVLLDRVLTYRLDQNGVTWKQKYLRRQNVLDAAQTLERAVSSPSTSAETAQKLGASLSDALLPSLPPDMGSDASLLLESDPLLQDLSWPVLPTPTGPLGLQYALAEQSSILAPNREHRQPHGLSTGEARSLIVGASVAGAGEPPLPEALKEARTVDRFLHSPDLLLGDQATTAHVEEALGSARIFHFAGHAIQTGNGTELLLAGSPGEESPWIDRVFLRQHPPLACRLAVLSACATGNREAFQNHPLQDIVETLGSLGVEEVVATRWQIDSGAAVSFMDSFYRNLAQGESVAMALTSARRVESSQSPYNNPYYWGSYYVSGKGTTHLESEFHARL